jgi:acyl-CoA synthetase (AMP-forming)/AMP-acid ligase II
MDDATYARLLAKAQLTKDLFTFDDFLRYWAQDRPDRLALEGDDLRFTFAGLEDATARVASGLLAMGVAKGERIAWYGKNRVK